MCTTPCVFGCDLDLSHAIQISKQISAKDFTTHFCRHGHPKIFAPNHQDSGARLRGRTTTHASKKGSEKGVLTMALAQVLKRVLRRCLVVGVKGKFQKDFSEGVLRGVFQKVLRMRIWRVPSPRRVP